MRVAFLSPYSTPQCETFIQSQKEGINADIYFYYGDLVPRYLEGEGLISIDRAILHYPLKLIGILWKINPFALKNSHLSILEYLFSKSLKKHKIDVVFAQYGHVGAAVLNACKYAKIPLVVHFHGRDSSAYDVVKDNKSKYLDMFGYATSIIAVSHTMVQMLIGLGCPKEKIVYAPCAPDDGFACITPSFNKHMFLSVGRFVDKKAPYLTLFAFKRVVEKEPSATLIMAGDGPLLPCCKAIAKELEIEQKVYFPGAVNSEQIKKWLSECLAYVQHSVRAEDGDMEGTPVAVMEALLSGVPVVSTLHAGIPDVVIDGKTGLLSKEHDTYSMSENMLKLIQTKDLAKTLGTAAKI